jgi:arylsulfatase
LDRKDLNLAFRRGRGEDRGAMLPGGIEAGWEVSAETMKGF